MSEQSQKQWFTTGQGRLVSGSVSQPNKTDAEGKPLVYKNGPDAGKPRLDYSFGVAFRKDDPTWQAIEAQIREAGKAAFPQAYQSPSFSWKMVDGDSTVPNKKGVAPNSREGYPGHMVLFFSTGYPPECSQNQGKEPLAPTEIEKGDYVMVRGSIASNGSANQPGLYINHNMVCLVAKGERITSGPSSAEVFGAAPPSAAPSAPAAPAAPPATPEPHHDFLAGAPAPPAAPVAPAAPPEPPKYVVSGQEYTKEQLLAAGWTEDQVNALPGHDPI